MPSFKVSPQQRKSSSNDLPFYQFLQRIIKFQIGIPKTIQFSQTTPESKKLTKKVFGCGIKTVANHPTSNLKALAYMFIVLCYKNDGQCGLKSALLREITCCAETYHKLINLPYSFQYIAEADLARFTIHSLNNMNQLMQTLCEKSIQETIQKYFVFVELIALFFRVLLRKLKFPGAEDYRQKLNTAQIYLILTQYFDINCQNRKPFYLLSKDGLFICSHDDSQFSFGRYYEDKTKLYESEEVIKKSTLEYLDEEQANSVIYDFDEREIGQSITLKDQENGKVNDFGLFSFRFDKHCKNEEERYKIESKTQLNTGINLNSLGYRGCDTDRSINCQELKECDIYSPYSENVVHHIGASRYLQDFIGETKNEDKVKQKNQYLSSSLFYPNPNQRKSHRKSHREKEQLSLKEGLSIFTCSCNVQKQKKITFCSKVYELTCYPPLKPYRKKRCTEREKTQNKVPSFILNRERKRQQLQKSSIRQAKIPLNYNPQMRTDLYLHKQNRYSYRSGSPIPAKNSTNHHMGKPSMNLSPYEKIRYSHRMIK